MARTREIVLAMFMPMKMLSSCPSPSADKGIPMGGQMANVRDLFTYVKFGN